MPDYESSRATKKLILVVIDGLTPEMLESGIESRRTPALRFLFEHGTYGRAVSAFPSLTPVCLASIATGGYPDVHHIPHLAWYHREERRIVEYGSSFGAMRAVGTRQAIRDAIVNMNASHLGDAAITVFEALADAGLGTAAVNAPCYRGRTRHRALVPGFGRGVDGPSRFFYYSLFESDATGAPIAVRARSDKGRSVGSTDAYAAAVGRWLVTRDGFDFLLFYLPDYDFASHAFGPEGAHEALNRSDRAVAALLDAADGWEDFLERYDLIVCSDHGQTPVHEAVHAQQPFFDLNLFGVARGAAELAVTASNRAAMVYRLPGCRESARALAARLDRESWAAVTLFREGDDAVARADGAELRFAPANGGWRTSGDARILAQPDALRRAWAALQNPNAGELIVSAAPGVEFADIAGRHHAGGGSHGSLEAGDSVVPMLTVGLEHAIESITEVAPRVLSYFGLEPPVYARSVAHAA
jgi:Type I phosphodiesterase / nucleotide pyrophosphatase